MRTVNGKAIFIVEIEYIDWHVFGTASYVARNTLKARIREEILKGISNSGGLAQSIKSISINTKPHGPEDPEA